MAAAVRTTKSRQRKVECPGCGCILYGSCAALSRGLPVCACGESFEVANLGDLAHIDPDAFEREVSQLGEGASNAAMRALGYDHAVYTTNARSIGTRQCRKRGCKALRTSNLADYCAKCERDSEPVPF